MADEQTEQTVTTTTSHVKQARTTTARKSSSTTPPVTPSPTRKASGSQHPAPNINTGGSQGTSKSSPGSSCKSSPTGSSVGHSQSGTSAVSSGKTSAASSTVATPSGSRSSSPHSQCRGKSIRTGLTWRPGARLEAMDYLKKWYAAKVVEVDEDEGEVLIHFEGWNLRFDEWVDMSSERLRPMIRHSGRKEPPTKAPRQHAHRVGDQVLARWTDCRLYPAKILEINTEGNKRKHCTYTVLFYDGFKKKVQKINIRTMPQDMKDELKDQKFPLTPPVLEGGSPPGEEVGGKRVAKPKMRPDGTLVEKRKSTDGTGKGDDTNTKVVSHEVKTGRDSKEQTAPSREPMPANTKKDDQQRVRKTSDGGQSNACRPQEHTKKRKIVVADTPQIKKAKLDNSSQKQADVVDSVAREMSVTKPPSPTGSQTKDISTGGLPLSADSDVCLADLLLDTKPEKKLKKTRLAPGQTSEQPDVKQRSASADDSLTGFVPPRKAFRVEEDHNHFKCTVKDCDKGFRKDSLLRYHVKYYHLAGTKVAPPPLATPAPRKRQKTISMCSTDSDVSVVSVGGKADSLSTVRSPTDLPPETKIHSTGQRPAKKKRIISAPSSIELSIEETIQEIIEVDVEISDAPPPIASMTEALDTTVAHLGSDSATTEAPHEEDDDPEDRLRQDEVVNCICGMNEEDDLMIQCDVCLCWQHAACFGLTANKLPPKYVCYVCLNPPGVRESARYAYDQDWFKTGQLAKFSFLSLPEQNQPEMLQTHQLVGNIRNMTTVLHGLRRKLHTLQQGNPDHPEVRLWTKNWDKEPLPSTTDTTGEHVPADNPGEENSPKPVNLITGSHSSSSSVAGAAETQRGRPLPDNTGPGSGSVKKLEVTGQSASVSDRPPAPHVTSIPDVVPDAIGAQSSDYKLSPMPSGVKLTGSSVWTPVAKQNLSTFSEAQSSAVGPLKDSPISPGVQPANNVTPNVMPELVSLAAVAQPKPVNRYHCEENLLEHIIDTQTTVDGNLDLIEERVEALERQSTSGGTSNADVDARALKRTLKTLLCDLSKVKRMSLYH